MISAFRCKKSAAVFALLFFLTSSVAADPDNIVPLPDDRSIFIFSEHLMEADATTRLEGRDVRKGDWTGDHFSFYGMDETASIRVISEAVGANTIQSIQMNALKGTSRRLQFLNVPPGNFLTVYYKVDSEEDSEANGEANGIEIKRRNEEMEKNQKAYFYLMIWVGSKLMRRIRIAMSDEGWHIERIPLEIVGFFNRELPVSFVVVGDKDTSSNFRLFSEISQ